METFFLSSPVKEIRLVEGAETMAILMVIIPVQRVIKKSPAVGGLDRRRARLFGGYDAEGRAAKKARRSSSK